MLPPSLDVEKSLEHITNDVEALGNQQHQSHPNTQGGSDIEKQPWTPSATESIHEPDVTAQHFSRSKRLSLLILLTLCASIDPIASTGFYPVISDVAKDFDTSLSVANLCSSLDFAGVATTALYWSYVSQQNGRKPVLAVSMGLTALFTSLCAASMSISMLIVMRLLSSASAAGIIITGAAAVGDMWETREKGWAMGIYFLAPLMSPALGPLFGGSLGQRWGWRAFPSFIAVFTALLLVLHLLLLPETRPQEQKNSRTNRAASCDGDSITLNGEACPSVRHRFAHRLVTAIVQPLFTTNLVRRPLIFCLLLVAAFSYGLTATLCVMLQSCFSRAPYNFDTLKIGLLFLPFAVGAIGASLIGGKISDHVMHRHADESGALVPENRAHMNAYFASILETCAFPAVGWVLYVGAPWYASIVPAMLLGISCGLNMGIVSTILIELIPAQVAGLMALNSMARNLFAAAAGSFAQPMADAMGVGWSFTVMCVLGIINLFAYAIIRKKGKVWRQQIWEAENVISGESQVSRPKQGTASGILDEQEGHDPVHTREEKKKYEGA